MLTPRETQVLQLLALGLKQEGGLVECPVSKGCEWATGMGCTEDCLFVRGREAQLAHMIQQGWVKLPSEDELALWLCDHLNCTSRELAQELLKLLNGCEILEVLAEFDRLTVRNVNLQTCLDTICEPIRTDGDIDYIKRTVIPLLYEQCKTISAQTLERVLAYLDSQKPSEKPSCCHQPNLGADCPICNPPLTQCPECIWGQKRREFTAVEGAYCKYVVYERCPRCKGEGRIPC